MASNANKPKAKSPFAKATSKLADTEDSAKTIEPNVPVITRETKFKKLCPPRS